MSNPDALAILTGHFDALKPHRVEVPFLPFPIFYRPLKPEEAFKMAKARVEKNSKAQAVMYAEVLVATVQHEDGEPVFKLEKIESNDWFCQLAVMPSSLAAALSRSGS